MKACGEVAPYDPKCVCIVDALSRGDSSCATLGVGADGRFNNPTNLRCLNVRDNPYAGSCQLARYGWYSAFPNLEQGIYAAVELYSRRYAGMTEENTLKVWADTSAERNPYYAELLGQCF